MALLSRLSSLNILAILFLLTSCSAIVEKVAVGTASGLFYDASKEVETENNWQTFKEGIPANLKLMEGMLYLEPENENLLASLTKGYAGYSFAIWETLYLDDFYGETESTKNKDQAIYNYSKALRYGMRYLKEYDLTYQQFLSSMNEEGAIERLLEENLDDDMVDLETVLFTAQSLGGLINLQKDKMVLVAQLPVVKGMFDWVCKQKPNISFGACQIFYGAYEAGRPSMLGGHPEEGKEIFLKLIKSNPDNLLARISYIQFYLIPMVDEEGYKKQSFYIEKAQEKFNEQRVWSPTGKEITEKEKKFRLFQTLALKRYEIIKKYEDEYF